MVESAERMAVAVEGTLEAGRRGAADGCPPAGVVDVGAQEELQVVAGSDVAPQGLVADEVALLDVAVIVQVLNGGTFEHTQVVEALQQVETVLRAAAVVVDVYLWLDDLGFVEQILVVDVVVVVGGIHYLLQVVVVGYGDGHGVGVGLAQIGPCIVGDMVVVLIEVEGIHVRAVLDAVDVSLGILRVVEELPSAACHLVGSGRDERLLDADGGAGQDDVGLLDVLDGGHAALELEVNIHHMALADRHDVHACHVGLVVAVLVDDGDNLLGGEVLDVGAAGHIERAGLGGRLAVDGEVGLVVFEVFEGCPVDDHALRHGGSYCVGAAGAACCHVWRCRDGFATVVRRSNRVAVAAIVIDALGSGVGKGQGRDFALLGIGHGVVLLLTEDLSGGIGRVAENHGGVDHIVFRVHAFHFLNVDGRVVAALVEQALVLGVREHTPGFGVRRGSVVRRIWNVVVAPIGGGVVDGPLEGVVRRIVHVVGHDVAIFVLVGCAVVLEQSAGQSVAV